MLSQERSQEIKESVLLPLSIGGKRKGITAVIAILMLLMMTVAAAGGAYVWMQSLQKQFQERGEAIANRDAQIKGMQCFNQGGDGIVEVFFKNSGRTELDLSPIDMDVKDFATGDINATLTRTGLSLSTNTGLSSGVSLQGNTDFSSPGDSALYEITLDSKLDTGKEYQVDFSFTGEEGLSRGQPCEAEAR
ncbi:MAG: archaellin/type IV pilin N-terminal domain-containing protein [Candidatus Nanohaloarchaea archaeon]|nr:archaellin/type IV pilin N-terminal domain-containing protein [Candidatus Nanohaloarchaea archaeon]